MKKFIYSILAISAVLGTSACVGRLEIPQKGVTAIENFYQTDADAEAALVAAYASFATNVPGRGAGFIYTPYKLMLNNCGDDFYAAGSNFGDNDFNAALNEYRYDSGLSIINEFYSGLFQSVYTANLVIDHFKDGLPNGGPTAVTKRCVAEARVLRAYNYFLLTTLWYNPPFVDHVLDADVLPYNCDKDPDNPMTHEQLLQWVAKECLDAANDLDERASTSDKNGAVKVTKGFAWALAGKTYVFLEDWANAKSALKKVIESGKYELVPGDKYWENFHIEGDGNSEKIFESNLEYNASIGAWGGINQRSTWMEANMWSWRSDHFVLPPHSKYTGGQDGWGGLGVPQWFGDEFFANDGHSPRFDATLKHIDDVVYNMEYNDDAINKMSLDEKKASTKIGIKDPAWGLYGQSFWLGFKQIMRKTDANPAYGGNVRLNNNIVMRYAEVLLLYAEACINSGDKAQAYWAVNKIQTRSGSKTITAEADITMDVIKKEKSYELWMEGCRFQDILRWGDTKRLEAAGSDVPILYDKLFRAPESGDKNVTWENGTEANSRFYTVSTTEAKDAGYTVGYQAKHRYFPFPMAVMEKNGNIEQHEGF